MFQALWPQVVFFALELEHRSLSKKVKRCHPGFIHWSYAFAFINNAFFLEPTEFTGKFVKSIDLSRVLGLII